MSCVHVLYLYLSTYFRPDLSPSAVVRMTPLSKLVCSLVRVRPPPSLLSSSGRSRLLSLSSSTQFRRPLDLDDEHMESVPLGGEDTVTSKSEMFPPTAEYDGPKERGLNSVTLMGRVGSEPVLRGSEDQPVTTFTLATNTHWKSGSEWREKTEWHNVVVFRPNLVEKAFNYVHKGARLHLTGRLTYGKYVDREGVERQTTSIVCDDIIFLSRKS